MTIKNGKGKSVIWVDGDGNNVPAKYIARDVKEREKVLDLVFGRIVKLEEKLRKEKGFISECIIKYLDTVAEKYGTKWQGNTGLVDFGGERKLDVNISKRICFDERLQVAKSLIDECVTVWADKSDDRIKTLISSAFKTDKKGNLDTKMILKLRALKFNDEKWKEAMDLISEAITVESTKQYFNFYRKNDGGEWEHIVLNFSNL